MFDGPTGQPPPYDQGWRVLTSTGEVYYHSAIAFLKLFNLRGIVPFDFPSVDWLLSQIGGREGVGVILSVDNRFILEQAFENKGVDYSGLATRVLINGEYQNFIPGTHVISVFGQKEDRVVLADPFYPPRHFKPCIFEVQLQTLNSYLRQPTQGIVISKTELNFPSQYLRPIYIPEQVEREIDKIRTELKL